jgi:cytoskeletal protein RodZ
MGKTLEEVSLALRISNRYLKGIEEGNYGGWPERVFASGFIRSYAKYLSVDPGPVLAEFERSIEQVSEKEAPLQARPEWLERERERGSRRTTYAFAAGAVLLVGIVLAWISMRVSDRPASPPPVAAVPAAPAAAPAVPTTADNAAAAPDNAAPARDGTDNAAPPAAPAPTVSAVGGSGPLTGPFQLFLEASAHTWVMYSFDDGDPIDVTLYVGDKISIQAKRRISLKLGNAGGVVGTLNGQRLPPFGESGQVRKITFGQ